MKNNFLIISSAFLITQVAYSQTLKPNAETKRPNIVNILDDDMDYSEMGSFGVHSM